MRTIVQKAIENHAAVNLCFIALMVFGWFSLGQMRRESFPEFDLDQISITVPYPSAAPEEVEQGVIQKIEEAVRAIEGIKKVTSTAAEGSGSVTLELIPGARNPDRVLDDVQSAVDRIPSLPAEAEEITVSSVTRRRPSFQIGVLRETDQPLTIDDQLRLRAVAENVRDGLLLIPEVAEVSFMAARDYQIDIEIPEDRLRAHGLTLRQAADVIRRENRELPAGSIRSDSQEILLRGNNRRTEAATLGELPLVTEPGGGVLTVADLGTVRDEFTDTTAINYVNGKPALALTVLRSTSQDLLAMVDGVQTYLRDNPPPPGYRYVTWGDESISVRSRLDLLVRNGWQGLLIVFVLLMIFLDPKLAFWVAMGIPFSLLTSAVFLYLTGQTINQISMFAFVMALGIVVDDAIVVGENIYAHREMGKPFARAAIDGTTEVIPSVLTAVATTVVAFAPLLFVSGTMGKFTAVMPMAIIAMLFVSLIECVSILPSHLSHKTSLLFRIVGVVFYVFRPLLFVTAAINRGATRMLDAFIHRVYVPTLRLALNNRIVVAAACVGLILVTAGMVRGGVVGFSFFPRLDGNTLSASVVFPDGTPPAAAIAATRQAEDAFWRVAGQYEDEGVAIAKTSYRVVGASALGASGSNRGSVEIELIDSEVRGVPSREIVNRWRAAVGKVIGAEEFTVGTRSFGPGGGAVEFKVTGPSSKIDRLESFVEACKAKLATFPGVSDIRDDSTPGKWEYRFRIKPEAFAMGVRTADLAETVRAAYFGEEVMRIQRGRHEVKIMVTYPRDDRRLLSNFDEIRVRLDDGVERPITELAEIDVVRSYAAINRIDQARAITVSADIDDELPDSDRIVPTFQSGFLKDLEARYPEVRVRWEGRQEQRAESFGSLRRGYVVAILLMFILLAIEFKSIVQPFLVLLIIPFGLFGAIVGHITLGIPLTLFSMYGIIALSGIVINDSIVLMDFINHRVAEGVPIQQALLESGARRLRPVMLTTITTIGGLLPILLETSLQAQILIPMATSIAFGELFATVLVLYLVPISYSMYHDAKHLQISAGDGADDAAGDAAIEPVDAPEPSWAAEPATVAMD